MGKPRKYGMKTFGISNSKADMRYRKKTSVWEVSLPPENPGKKKKKGAITQ